MTEFRITNRAVGFHGELVEFTSDSFITGKPIRYTVTDVAENDKRLYSLPSDWYWEEYLKEVK